MKVCAASVLLLALLGTAPAGADSTRRRDVVDLTRLELLRTLSKGWTHSLAPGGQAFAVFDANLVRIIDTYEGMLSYCNNGEGADHLFASLDKAQAEKARLEAEWNGLLLAAEAA